jgi:hypothetical protein
MHVSSDLSAVGMTMVDLARCTAAIAIAHEEQFLSGEDQEP